MNSYQNALRIPKGTLDLNKDYYISCNAMTSNRECGHISYKYTTKKSEGINAII